jgi:SAM-dependent methyltransferase
VTSVGVDARPGARETEGLGACPGCASVRLRPFYEQHGIPVHSCRLVDTREEALGFPRGALSLAFCADCGLITNTAFDPELQDYGIDYEETQGFSPTFRQFARVLALRWIDRYGLRGKAVLEIGCGKGEFLALLCELGVGHGIGIDPAFVSERLESEAAERLTFIRDLYDERFAALEADAIVCRHTLEHIAPVADFLSVIRRSQTAGPDTAVLFDLPDVLRVLREPAFWDLYYEHCSYFSAGSLARLFRRSGFRVVRLERDYDDQYLVLEAFPGDGGEALPLPLEERPEELAGEIERFRVRVREYTRHWRGALEAARGDGRRTVVWGAGSKGVAFLTTLGVTDEVAYAVDVNPHKHGKFLAGAGHAVVGPDHLTVEPPDLVVAMNAVYLEEIRAELDARGLQRTELRWA